MKLYISKATLRTIEKFGNASLTHISATPSDHMSVELDATPLANEASKPACAHRIVDARNEIVKSGYLCVDCGAVFAGIHAPAAPLVEQDERGVLIRAFDASLSGVPRYVIDRFGVEHVADGGGWIKESDLFDRFAASTSANVGKLDPRDALRYMACRESAIERGLFATPEEYDAMVDDSLRKNGKEVLTGRGHNYGKKVAKDGSLYRPTDDAARAASTSANGDRFDPYRLKVAEECCERLMSACTDAGCPDGVRMDDWIRDTVARAASTSANVAQGAEAVVNALEETQGLLVAMLHEKRSTQEIEQQIGDNRTALQAFASAALTAAQSASGETK